MNPKKRIIQSFLAYFASFWILISSVGVGVQLHFCHDSLKKIEFWEAQASSCQKMAHSKTSCCPKKDSKQSSDFPKITKSCCSDKLLLTQQVEQVTQKITKIVFPQKIFADFCFFQRFSWNFLPDISFKFNNPLKYICVLLTRDICVLFERFIC